MRVLIVTHNYPRFQGDPAGAYVARLARATAASGAGAAVRVVAPHALAAPVAERDGAVDVRRFRYAPAWLEPVGYRGDVRRRGLFSPLTLCIAPVDLLLFRQALRR